MASTSYGTGIVHASEKAVRLYPRLSYDAIRHRGVLYLHGSTASALTVVSSNGYAQPTMLNHLADKGYPLLACDLGASLTNWYNDAEGLPRIDEAYTYAMSTLGWKAGKVHIFAASMGNVGALRWAQVNLDKVASIACAIPAYDMETARVANVTLRGQIDTAYGVTYPAPLPAGENPPDFIDDIAAAGIPWKGYYSSDDEADFVAGAIACADALDGELTSLGALGHTDAAIGAVPFAEVAAFYRAYDA